MASTSLEIVISANDRFSATADRVIGKLHGIGSASKQVGKGVGELGVGLARVGAVGFVALAGGLAAAAKAGVDFEDAFAGVRKTVGGSKASLDALYNDLRKLATRIPVKFTDLADIATEAGALGVPANEIVHFTEVIARLSAATQGLTTAAASEAIGKLGNILHIHGADLDRFASSLVALGNAGASTESDIIETAKRFGAAGSAAKLSAAQVLGFSSAIASLGVEPEAAGSALSRLFNKITRDIGTGDAKLKQFAATAGLSTTAFTKLFKGDSTAGMLAFLKGLGKLDRFQVSKVLKDAGVTNIRDVNAVLLLSQNYDLLAKQLDVSSDAFAKNTALAEASKARFDTLKSKLQVFKNAVLDAGASIAEGLNPAIGRLADKLTAFVSAHKGDFIKFGQDIGKFIDEIDWTKVQRGAETFVDLMKTLLSIVQKIPPEVDAAVAGFLGINKISGGLIGKGLGDIAGGLVGLVTRSLGALLPGKLGGLVGALTAQPVFVTNWPLGGFGGVPGVPGAAVGGAAKVATIGSDLAGLGKGAVKLTGTLGLMVLAFEGLAAVANATSTAEQQATTARNSNDQERFKHTFGGAIGPTGTKNSPLAVTILDRGGREAGQQSGNITPRFDASNLHAALTEFTRNIGRLRLAVDPASVRRAATELAARVAGGHGSVAGTTAALAALRTQLKNTHDPQTERVLRAAIHEVSAKLPGRQFAARELATADHILASNKTSAQKIGDLKKIEQQLKDHGLPHAAAQINAKIEVAKKAQVAASARAGQVAAAAIRNKEWQFTVNTTVNTSVSIRDQIRREHQISRVSFKAS